MRPGPDIIKKCLACFKLIKEATLASGNNFGATYWTDGKEVAPMLPLRPWLVKCPHCQTLVWLDTLEEVGLVDPFEDLHRHRVDIGFCNENILSPHSDQFEGATEYQMPSIDDYFNQLESGVDSAQKVLFLRRSAWWLGNDVRRGNPDPTPMSIRETTNLVAFAAMLDASNDNELLMKAEAMRELGHFAEALSLLAQVRDEDYIQSVQRIKALCEAGHLFVQELRFTQSD